MPSNKNKNRNNNEEAEHRQKDKEQLDEYDLRDLMGVNRDRYTRVNRRVRRK